MDMQVDAGRRTNDEMFKASASLAQKGLKIVRLYGISVDGVCECPKGQGCRSPGKQPFGGDGWQHRATSDEEEIGSWFEDERAVVPNIGVLLGAASGIIDVEADTPEGIAAMKKYGLDEVDTPAFQSGRSPHYIFLSEPGLPNQTVVKFEGIEVRLGNGGAAQTVFPPSMHANGHAREWLPGRSPEDCDFQPLPRAFREAIVRAGGGKGKGMAKAARDATAAGRVFREGEGRHDQLYGVAVSLALTLPHSTDGEVECIHRLILGQNAISCDPPYPEDEVRRWTNDAIYWVREKREQDLAEQRTPWERAGLRKRNNHWEPGNWRAVVVHSDPLRYRLIIPSADGGEPVRVNLTDADWMTPKNVARKVLAATGTVNLQDPTPKKWASIWSGSSPRNGEDEEDTQRGLAVQLLEDAYVTHEYPPPELSRAATVASLLHSHLIQAREPKDEKDTKPSDSGSAKWLYHEGRQELWFHWNTVWKEINETAEIPVTGAEKQDLTERLLRELGIKEFAVKQGSSGKRLRYMRWGKSHLQALAGLAGLEDRP